MAPDVWIIDDSETDLLYSQIVVERASPGVAVEPFESAIDALQVLADPAAPVPRLIFLDINMPRMSGFEFLEACQSLPAARRAQVVVVMLSSSPLHADRQRALAFPAVRGYVTKPLATSEVARWLDGSAAAP